MEWLPQARLTRSSLLRRATDISHTAYTEQRAASALPQKSGKAEPYAAYSISWGSVPSTKVSDAVADVRTKGLGDVVEARNLGCGRYSSPQRHISKR
jgi:hypothetical protein